MAGENVGGTQDGANQHAIVSREHLAHLLRAYFKLDGHHIQFIVVTAETLAGSAARAGQASCGWRGTATTSATWRPCRARSSRGRSRRGFEWRVVRAGARMQYARRRALAGGSACPTLRRRRPSLRSDLESGHFQTAAPHGWGTLQLAGRP